MRNPLNAIIAMLDKIRLTASQIDDVISDRSMPDHLKEALSEHLDLLNESTKVIHCSTKQLSLTVNDMLSLAQLDSDKFRIKLESFDIRDSVQEVMDIQF